jgi:hypothetical protein
MTRLANDKYLNLAKQARKQRNEVRVLAFLDVELKNRLLTNHDLVDST